MSSKEEREILKRLVQHACRAFYDTKYTIVMDQLVRHPVLKEDDLAGRVGLQLKELSKITAVLHADKLLKIYRQNELKEGASRVQSRQYFYIDYQHFCNVVKWRISEMFRIIDSKLRNELDNKGYICPTCSRKYTPLDVDRLFDPMRQTFICEDCKSEVIENENAESVRGSQDRMQRFNHQVRFIRDGLQKIDSMVLPAFNVQEWLRKHPSEEAKRAAEREAHKTGAVNGVKKEPGMEIVMSKDKDEATQRAEREKEAETKRQQNIMPSWHTKSTITGELTALGHAAAAQTPSQISPVAPSSGSNAAILESLTNPSARQPPKPSASSNASILSGLGKAPKAIVSHETGVKIEESVKQAAPDDDFYEEYYATLQADMARTAMVSPWSSWTGESDDRKPDLNYLDGRRGPSYPASPAPTTPWSQSQTPDDNGSGTNANGKRPREEDGFGFGGAGGEMALAEEVGFVADVTDDPIVHVQGKAMKFSEVTEEHHDQMTPEEYQAYYEMEAARSGL